MYDVIIIGAGPAGLSAAIYASRAKLKTAVIEKAGCGGQMAITDMIENYPGFDAGINGFELASKLETQARFFGTEIIYDEVVSLSCQNKIKEIKTSNSLYKSKTIIIAAGTKVRRLNIPGEAEFIGKGVSTCAVCDAPFYKDKDVMVIGGGDSAVQESLYLTKFAKSVTLVHRRDTFRATKILQDKLLSCKKIKILYNHIPKKIEGNQNIEKVIVEDIKTNKTTEVKVDGIFVFIGLLPNTSFLSQIKLDENKYIITDENMQTSQNGVFACGDIRRKQLRQVVTAASDGAQAAVSVQHFIEFSK